MYKPSNDSILNFQKFIKNKYSVSYSEKETEEALCNLVNVFKWLLEEDRKQNPNKYKKYAKRNNNKY